jgi:hypothetical protein
MSHCDTTEYGCASRACILYFVTFTIPCPSKVSYKYKTNYYFVLQVCSPKFKKVSLTYYIKMLIMFYNR